MSRAAAKKYAKVLLNNTDEKTLQDLKSYLQSLSSLFKEEKFKDTILSPLVKSEDKLNILTANNENKTLKNFLNLLIEKDRVSLIPFIYEELRVAEAIKNNQFDGFIYTAGDVNSETIQELTKNIEQKTNAKINFKLQKDEIDGFKVEVPDLGIEASFSNDRLKQQLISHILRGI